MPAKFPRGASAAPPARAQQHQHQRGYDGHHSRVDVRLPARVGTSSGGGDRSCKSRSVARRSPVSGNAQARCWCCCKELLHFLGEWPRGNSIHFINSSESSGAVLASALISARGLNFLVFDFCLLRLTANVTMSVPDVRLSKSNSSIIGGCVACNIVH